MPLHAEALLLQLKALLLSLKALLLPKKGEIHAIVGKNVIFYLFFYKNKKTPHNLTYPPFSPVFMRLPDSDLFSREVTV